MYKVLIFAGTVEGRGAAEYLAAHQVPVMACVATEYGAELMEESPFLTVSKKRLQVSQMAELMQAEGCRMVIDATHPYAAVVSANIREAAALAGKQVIRLLRDSQADELDMDFVAVDSVPEAARFLCSQEGHVLITTGSKELKEYTIIPGFAERLHPRFLPAPGAVEAAAEMGYLQKNMICMQGPFSKEINIAMLRQTGSTWLVTKETGKAGGFLDKVQAAKEAGARLIVVGRPVRETGLSEDEVRALINREFGIQAEAEDASAAVCGVSAAACGVSAAACDVSAADNHPAAGSDQVCGSDEQGTAAGSSAATEADGQECASDCSGSEKRIVTLIGIGMGTADNMTIEAMRDCQEADAILGATRMTECVDHLGKPVFHSYKDAELREYLDNHPEYKKAVILLSGDIGFYSGAKKLISRLEPDYEVRTRSGISSVVYFCGKLKTAWEDVKLMSLHGKSGNLIAAVARYKKVFALIGGKDAVGGICSQLTEYGFGNVTVSVGTRLSYPDEEILTGKAEELAGKAIGGLCVILVENPQAGSMPVTHGIEDEAFLRAKVPMTKAEVRSISLSKMRLKEDSIVYDVGAGTGSVSIEAALQAPEGFVYAIEKKEEACDLIEQNKRHFHAANIEVIKALAPEGLADLPAPTHAFIGGSSGNMKEIIEALLDKNPRIRIVINCIALESVSETLDCLRTLPLEDVDILHIASARSKKIGRYNMMTGMNPIYIISCSGSVI